MENSCNGCGLCCKLFYINLSEKEYKSGKYKTMFQEEEVIENFTLAKDCGANLLAKNDDNSCVYLVNNQCSIHEDRPGVCRDFFCTTKAKRFEGMVEIIEKADKENISSVKLMKR
jgi:Fe-S-cluster containining protein